MSKDRFIPRIEESRVISIRLKNDLIEKIDELAKQRKMSRNELLCQSIIFSLERLDEDIKG